MDITYTITGLIFLLGMVYVYSRTVFAFSRMGEDYLQSLVDKPEEYGSDPEVSNALKNRDLPRLVEFISIEGRIQKIMLVALIVNVVGIFYPTEALLETYLGWILLLLLTIVNVDAIMTFFALRQNKKIVSRLCNGYYNLTQAYKLENEKFHNMADSIERAFAEIEQTIKEKLTEVETDADDEQH